MVRLLRSDRPRARNYFARREQWRLLLLLFAIGVVYIVISALNRQEAAERLGQVSSGAKAPAATEDVPLANTPPVAASSRSPELSAEAVATIRDNTYFLNTEKDAWFELIAKLQRTPPAELAARSVGEVGYAQLAQQPSVYRAKTVTVRGTVRQVTAEKPAANDLGLESYYRLVLQPSGGEIWPIFIYVLDLPADFRGARKWRSMFRQLDSSLRTCRINGATALASRRLFWPRR